MAEDFRAEYDRLFAAFDDRKLTEDDIADMLWHILARLGRPEPLDGIDADKLTDATD
jgi:hypothetical protein